MLASVLNLHLLPVLRFHVGLHSTELVAGIELGLRPALGLLAVPHHFFEVSFDQPHGHSALALLARARVEKAALTCSLPLIEVETPEQPFLVLQLGLYLAFDLAYFCLHLLTVLDAVQLNLLNLLGPDVRAFELRYMSDRLLLRFAQILISFHPCLLAVL